jgi:cation:H+ antiporter
MPYILFLLGFVLLIKSADVLVDGAGGLARRLGVSALVVGLTIVSFGTSAPELLVTLLASSQGSADMAIGNVLGSNIANILLILGVAGVITPLGVGRGTVWKEIPFAALATLLLGFMANDAWLDGRGFSDLARIDGLVLLSFFAIFIYYTFSISKVEGQGDGEVKPAKSVTRAVVMVVLGLAGLALGGRWVVSGATEIARGFGVSEALIGLTIVSLGTSLPELVTSAVAAYRKEVDIAVGNVVGSNIFNVFLVLGVSSTVRPLSFNPSLAPDLLVGIAVSLLLFVVMFIGHRHVLQRWQAALFLVIYFAYVGSLTLRHLPTGLQ